MLGLGVDDFGGDLDVSARRALANLVGLSEAPGPGGAISGDGNGVLGTTGSGHELLVGDLGGSDQDAVLTGDILDDVVFAKVVLSNTGLMRVHAAPAEEITISSDDDGVALATRDVGDLVLLEFLDDHGLGDGEEGVGAIIIVDASLAVAVETPGPDLTIDVDGERVVVTRVNRRDLLAAGDVDGTGLETVDTRALNNATTQLILLPVAPSVNNALVVEDDRMISTTDGGDDVLELWDLGGSILDAHGLGETKDTIGSLFIELAFVAIKSRLTLLVNSIDIP